MSDAVLSRLLRTFCDGVARCFHPSLNRRIVTFVPMDNGNGSVHYALVLSLYSDDLGKDEIIDRDRWHNGLTMAVDGAASLLADGEEGPNETEPYTGSDGLN